MKLSIIIPSYNEELELPKLLTGIGVGDKRNVTEIIVVDGGSTDETRKIALKHKCRTITSSVKRRAIQMDLGAKIATGDTLLFVHADSIPPKKFKEDIDFAICNGYDIGSFGLEFTPSNGFLRFFEKFVGLPWLLCRGGDQGLFIDRKLYNQIGGFNVDLHIMEDIDIIRRAVKHAKFKILRSKMLTSSRSYLKYGNYKLQLAFGLVHAAYWAGIDSRIIKTRLNKFLEDE